jgi:hypothetical protein
MKRIINYIVGAFVLGGIYLFCMETMFSLDDNILKHVSSAMLFVLVIKEFNRDKKQEGEK